MNKKITILNNVIKDKGSKYSVSGAFIENESDVRIFLEELKKDKKIRKATHNTYAYRFFNNNKLIENKNDDGETGTGIIILNQMRSKETLNTIICVTRWFGGVKLGGDRFRHVKNAVDIFLKTIDKNN